MVHNHGMNTCLESVERDVVACVPSGVSDSLGRKCLVSCDCDRHVCVVFARCSRYFTLVLKSQLLIHETPAPPERPSSRGSCGVRGDV